MKFLILYIITASVTEFIILLRAHKKIKEAIAKDATLQMIKNMVLSSASGKLLKKYLFHWYGFVFVGIPLLVIISPLLFPYTLYSWLRSLIFGKSKLEKAAEAEAKAMEAAEAESKKFMETEGRMSPDLEYGDRIITPDFGGDFKDLPDDSDDLGEPGKLNPPAETPEPLVPDKELIEFAEDFSKKYKDIAPGIYQSDSGKYTIEYLEHITDQGMSVLTNARVAVTNTIYKIQLDKTKLADGEIPSDYVFAVIIWCWFRVERYMHGRHGEFDTDKAVIDYFLCAGKPIDNIIKGWTYSLSLSPSELNAKRIEQFKIMASHDYFPYKYATAEKINEPQPFSPNMKVTGLDADTQGIIDAMCSHTGKTQEQAILALVEFGMLSMIAATLPVGNERNRVIYKVFETVEKDEKLLATAKAYAGYWSV